MEPGGTQGPSDTVGPFGTRETLVGVHTIINPNRNLLHVSSSLQISSGPALVLACQRLMASFGNGSAPGWHPLPSAPAAWHGPQVTVEQQAQLPPPGPVYHGHTGLPQFPAGCSVPSFPACA